MFFPVITILFVLACLKAIAVSYIKLLLTNIEFFMCSCMLSLYTFRPLSRISCFQNMHILLISRLTFDISGIIMPKVLCQKWSFLWNFLQKWLQVIKNTLEWFLPNGFDLLSPQSALYLLVSSVLFH